MKCVLLLETGSRRIRMDILMPEKFVLKVDRFFGTAIFKPHMTSVSRNFMVFGSPGRTSATIRLPREPNEVFMPKYLF